MQINIKHTPSKKSSIYKGTDLIGGEGLLVTSQSALIGEFHKDIL